MSLRVCAVTVKQFPEKVNIEQGRLFLRELESNMDVERPYIVFDCSQVLQMDMSAVQLLLNCLEDAMKRNGDIKLAAIPADAKAVLKQTGVDHLFEVFDTNDDAVNSFHRLPLHAASQDSAPPSNNSYSAAQNAA
jgi:anti-anti-sigma factor